MRLGVLQGRLTPPVNGHYQEFPNEWKQEIEKVKQLSLAGVEWLITPECNKNNPLLVSPKSLDEEKILSVCVDTLVDKRITDEDFLKDNLLPVCNALEQTEIKNLTIPILDDSDLNDDLQRKEFCKIIKQFGDNFPNLNFCFEAEMPPAKLHEIICLCDNFYVTYDTGNITSCGVDHEHFIDFFRQKIINVHIKDRTYKRQTVEPLSGDTNFDLIFKRLSEVNYNGFFILQTAREVSGDEFETIKKHKKIFEEIHEKYF